MSEVLAPAAPGALGQRLDPAELQTYLTALDGWVRGRKDDLDDIDSAVLAAPDRGDLTGDVTLSMALWKAVADRAQLLTATWDGGRVGPTERERLSSLIWGRLDATLDPRLLERAGREGAASGALALSLPEACRLSDALAHQLRVALALDPAAEDQVRRVRTLRESLERLRDQVALEPADGLTRARATLDVLAGRVEEVAAKVGRGGDVGGLLGPLENDTARFERDLIVGGARRRDAQGQVVALTELLDDLLAREAALTALAGTTVRTVVPAPRLAVPDVSLLGPVPGAEPELTAYAARLSRVAAAMNLAHERYAAALASRDTLVQQLDALELKAKTLGVAGDPDLRAAVDRTREVLDRRPCPVAVVKELVDVCASWLALAAGNLLAVPKESA